jgi:hypothetical protein
MHVNCALQHCHVSLKTLYPGGIRTWVLCFHVAVFVVDDQYHLSSDRIEKQLLSFDALTADIKS